MMRARLPGCATSSSGRGQLRLGGKVFYCVHFFVSQFQTQFYFTDVLLVPASKILSDRGVKALGCCSSSHPLFTLPLRPSRNKVMQPWRHQKRSRLGAFCLQQHTERLSCCEVWLACESVLACSVAYQIFVPFQADFLDSDKKWDMAWGNPAHAEFFALFKSKFLQIYYLKTFLQCLIQRLIYTYIYPTTSWLICCR